MRLVLIAAAAAVALPAAAFAQDGTTLFNTQCKSCHSITAASGPAGPSLKGVYGRKIAGAPGYAYSTGLKVRSGTWGDANLDAFLANPAGFAPGGKMFVKVAKPADRAALIAYMKTVK
jgi:cytochrome c2